MSLKAARYKKNNNKWNMPHHAWNQQAHTFRKFKIRHGIDITYNEYLSLINQIQSRRSTYVQTITKRLKNHVVELRGELFLVGFDKRTKQIATVLPKERLTEVFEKEIELV